MNSTSPLKRTAFYLVIFSVGLTVNVVAQSLVASPNNISLKVNDIKPTVIKITQDEKPVPDLTCKIPIQSFGNLIAFSPGKTDKNGQISITGKGPSQGVIIVCSDGKTNSSVNIYITRIGVHTDGPICADIALMRSQAERINFFADMTPRMSEDDMNATLDECESDKISATPTILDYKTVRDNYGKGIGESFVVIQINIRNKSTTSEFYLQDVVVALDPKKCDDAKEFFSGIYKYDKDLAGEINDAKSKPDLKVLDDKLDFRREQFADQCVAYFDKYFEYPIGLDAMGRDKVLGVANANIYRSPRRIGFEIADFVSAMNPVLTGLKWLGRDGKLGFGFLGTTIIPAADTGVPNIANDKLENLKGAIPDAQIIVPSGGSAVVNVFVETRYFLNKETFPLYMMNAKNASVDAQRFDRLLKLFLVSSVNGKLISNDSPTVASQPKGGTPPTENFRKP